MTALAVFIGGGLGAMCRWGVGMLALRLAPNAVFPWATFAVNIVGCFLLGFLAQLFVVRFDLPQSLRVGSTTGFLGGLTTFSTFGNDSAQLLGSVEPAYGWANIVANVVVGVAAAGLGLWIATRMTAP